MRTRFISGFLLLAMLFCGSALPANAAADPPAISDTYEIDGVTYYNVNSKNFDSDKKFYEDVFAAKHSSLGGRSIGDLWMLTAVGIGKTLPVIKDAIPSYAKEAAMKEYGSGYIKYNGLGFGYSYTAPKWSNSKYVETSLTVGGGGYGNCEIRVVFSDFGVGVILPGSKNHYVTSTIENDTPKGTQASSTKNDTNNTVTVDQETSRTVAESLKSSINHSFSYGFTEGVKVGAGFSVEIFEVASEFSFEASQTITDGWSEEKGTDKSDTFKSGISVTLPPYTNVLMKSGESDTTVTTKYNCPVMVSYKVTIYYVGGWLGADNISFGKNAREDLKKRAITDVDYDPQYINWRTVVSDSDMKNAVEKIASHVPMSSTGATMVFTDHTIYNEVAGISPLYPLAYVELGNSNISFIDNNTKLASMQIGNYSYTNYLSVMGYNARGGEYYGFNKNNGRWIVVDDNGKEMSESTAPVVIENSSESGYTKFKAVRAGHCWMKYLIDEKSYPSSQGSGSYTKNSELSRTAMLEVNVAAEKITFEIDGDYTGKVGAEAENIESDDKLEVSALDSTGREVEAAYHWEAKETRNKGIKLEPDGMVSFTKARKFHVRVINEAGDVFSAWKEITAELLGDDYEEPEITIERSGEADSDTNFVITGSFTGGVSLRSGDTVIKAEAENIEGDGKLQVETHDSTAKENLAAYVWEEEPDDNDGMNLTADGQVSFTAPGIYHVRVKSGEFHSDWIEIKANEIVPARFIRVPTANGNYYNGTEQELLYDDARYEGGVRLLYALGENDTNEPNEYSTEIPTATEKGTYYVWCKIQPDEKHSNSESVCVIAKIESSDAPDEEPDDAPDDKPDDEPDGKKNNPGSSSGGCDSGISALSLVIVSALLIVRRKTK